MGNNDKKKTKKAAAKEEEEEKKEEAPPADESEDEKTDDKKEDDKMEVDEAKAESKDKKEGVANGDKKKATKQEDDDEEKDGKDAEKSDDEDGDTKEKEDSKKRGRRKRGAVDEEAPSPSGREKRARKSAAVTAYKPEDFSQVDHSPTIIDGKGTPIGDMEKAKDAIESYKDNSEELAMAYRFLYAPRGRLSLKDIKPSLLRFNGYIPKPADGEEETDIKKAESAAEVGSRMFTME